MSRIASAWERAEQERRQKEKDKFHKARKREIAEGKRTTGATAGKKKNKHGRAHR